MEQLDTPGKRLRYFGTVFFTSITDFAHHLGFQKPGSLYDYFNNRKRPGGLLLDKFLKLGGDPAWLRYGTGSMFADNEAGKQRRLEYIEKFPYSMGADKVYTVTTDGAPVREPAAGYRGDSEFATGPLDQPETVYLLLSRVLYRLKTSPELPEHLVPLLRKQVEDIRYELDRRNEPQA